MSQVIDQDETYTYEILQEKDCIECAALLAHSFTKQNPYELYMKTTYEKFYLDALTFCKVSLRTNLSVIARDKQTNEIHAVVQCVDQKTFDDEGNPLTVTEDDKKHFNPIFQILDVSKTRYLDDYKKKYGDLKENTVAHILMAGVRLDNGGQGLGTKLNRVLLEHIRRRGFKHVVVDASNPAMHYIYTKKLNGKVFTSINTATWTAKNEKGDDYQPLEHFNAEITFIVFDF